MLNVKIVTTSLALFLAFSFTLCIIYGLMIPQNFHMHTFLEAVLPGFKWLSVGSFILGLFESAAWGAYIGLVYSLFYNFFSRRWKTT